MKYLILGILFIMAGALNAVVFKNTSFTFVAGIMLGIGAILIYKFIKLKCANK